MQSKALVINDLSSFGKCSLTAATAVLSAMDIQPCPLPTAVLSSQSEFPHRHQSLMLHPQVKYADRPEISQYDSRKQRTSA